MKIVVLGVGNILLSDEGVGVHAVEALRSRYRLPETVEAVDGGTAGMELLSIVADADHLILLDAIHSDQPAGTLIRLDDDQVPAFFRTKVSPHQVGLADVLAASELSGCPPRRITLLGCVPASMALGMELTAAILPQMERMVGLVAEELGKLGQPASPLPAGGTV